MRSKTNLPIPYRFNHIAHKWGKTDFPLSIVFQYDSKPSGCIDGLYQKDSDVPNVNYPKRETIFSYPVQIVQSGDIF